MKFLLLMLFLFTSCAILQSDGFFKDGSNGNYTIGNRVNGKLNGLVGSKSTKSRYHSRKGWLMDQDVITQQSFYENGKKQGYATYKSYDFTRIRNNGTSRTKKCGFLYKDNKLLPYLDSTFTDNSKNKSLVTVISENEIKVNEENLCRLSQIRYKNFFQRENQSLKINKFKISNTGVFKDVSKRIQGRVFINSENVLQRDIVYNPNIKRSLKISSDTSTQQIEVIDNLNKKTLYTIEYPLNLLALKTPERGVAQSYLHNDLFYYGMSKADFDKKLANINPQKYNDSNQAKLTIEQLEEVLNYPKFEITENQKKTLKEMFTLTPALISQNIGILYNLIKVEEFHKGLIENFNQIKITKEGKELAPLKTVCEGYITSANSCKSNEIQSKLFLKDYGLSINEKNGKGFNISLLTTNNELWAGEKRGDTIDGFLYVKGKSFFGKIKDYQLEGRGESVHLLKEIIVGNFKNGLADGDLDVLNEKREYLRTLRYADGEYIGIVKQKMRGGLLNHYTLNKEGKKTKLRTYLDGKLVGTFKYSGNGYNIESGKGKCVEYLGYVSDCVFKKGRRVDSKYIEAMKHQAYLAEKRRIEEERKRLERERKEAARQRREDREHRRWLRKRRKKQEHERAVMAMKFAMIDRQYERNKKRINRNYQRKLKQIESSSRRSDERYEEKMRKLRERERELERSRISSKSNSEKARQERIKKQKVDAISKKREDELREKKISLENKKRKELQDKREKDRVKKDKEYKIKLAKAKALEKKQVDIFMGRTKPIKNPGQAEKAAFSACWQSNNRKFWFCSGPLQETHGGFGTFEEAIKYSGCAKNYNLYKHARGIGRLKGKDIMIYNCNKTIGKNGRDIFSLGIFVE